MNSSPDPQPTVRVFVSATSGDLGSVREIVKQGLLTMGCLPVEQTAFAPDYRTVAEMLAERIRGCDAVIHLVGLSYGSEPDPTTLPPGARRRSFSQMEADLARGLGRKLYVFLCPEDFPFDPGEAEPEEKAALQRAYREEIGQRSTLHTRVADRSDVAQRVRELQLDLDRVRERFGRHRRRSGLVACGFALLLVALAGAIWWNIQRTPAVIQKTLQEEQAAAYDPIRMKANLQKQIRQRAAEEFAKLDRVRDWQKIAVLEKGRDQQLEDVDRLIEQISQVFEKKEASANYATANQILAEKGVAETLRFLESKSGGREAKIAVLKQSLELTERARAAQEGDLRELLREKLLKASLLEKNLQYEKAAEEYRAVIADGGSWVEPRNALAWLLSERGKVIDPAKGSEMLREAVALCRGTLSATLRATSPQDWASAQSVVGNTLETQGERAVGQESHQLLAEAVTAYRAALEVYTREQLPQYWAIAQNNLAIALQEQSTRAGGEESRRLLTGAVTAYRAALEVEKREQLPQDWARAQTNLGVALKEQGTRADGQESERLLTESVTSYRAALEVYTREQFPLDWARAQTNLGNTLVRQGTRAVGQESQRLLTEAVTSYRAALEVCPREQLPQAWAMVQANLAAALEQEGTRADGQESQRLLTGAVTEYRAVLEVYTRAQFPKRWAMTQSYLGNALQVQGTRADGQESERLLTEAVTAYRAALEVYTREQVPQGWSDTQNNLGLALKELSKRVDGPKGKLLNAEAERVAREVEESVAGADKH